MKMKLASSRVVLVGQAILIFVLLDVCLLVFGFRRVYEFARWCSCVPADDGPAVPRPTVDRILEAVRTATRYYFRRRLDCLPRSLTIYLLLRRRGIPVSFHIGVKRYPFGAHAWVECLGEVLDDSANTWRHEPYTPILSM